LLQAPVFSSAGETWYQDMVAHWAHDYVRLLWEEQVSDGFQGSWAGYSSSVFMPQASCTRAQMAVLLAKAFRLAPQAVGQTFSDVPPGYCICYNKPAHPYIEAAARKSLIKGTGYGAFAPERGVRREEAIGMIIRGLDIGYFLDTLDQNRITTLLGRFLDGASVSQSLRTELAAATLLKVVYGYPDRTLRSSQDLLRGEAAALIARSCMIRARSSLPCFSPDGDGVEDTVLISLDTLKNRAVLDYGIVIDDLAGQPVRWWYGWIGSASPVPPNPERWDGTDGGGRRCGDGLYLYAAWVRDRQGQIHWSAYKPLMLERPAVWAFVDPAVVMPGGSTELSAYASGRPARVLWKDTGSPMMLAGGHWTTHVQVPPGCDEGEYCLTVEATYQSSATRQAVAHYTVIDPFPLASRVVPSPASPGQAVAIFAYTSERVTGVDAVLPWEDVPRPLTHVSTGTWRLDSRVPRDALLGRYAIRVTARTPSRHKTVTVWLEVTMGPLQDYVFSLVS
ncbi:MAG: S-layer homology domain-containing protein, partial [Bacillota bacterium]|nr:S-layer homology domain-containing protein [Bacillota bacterium]